MKNRNLIRYAVLFIIFILVSMIWMNSSNFLVIEEKLANQKIENKNSLNSKSTIASSFASILVPSDFIFGADLSSYPQVIDGGGIYKEGLGKGIIVWEPAWIYPCVGSTPTQDRGFFDLDDSLLSVYSIPLVRYSFESNYTNTSSNNSTHFTSTFIAGYPILLNFLSIPLAITIIIIKKELWWNY